MAEAGAEGLTLFEVSKSFGSAAALESVSLRVTRGEVVALFGPNGAGKTTLVRAAAGLLRPTAGRVLIDGHDLAKAPAQAKRLIGWTPDSPALYDELTAAENLVFFARLWGLSPEAARDASKRALSAAGLAHRAADPAGDLSHGMRQRLSLARAVLHDPTVLLLDEPFEGLDAAGASALVDALRVPDARAKRACLIAGHQVELALAACDRFAILDRGRLLRVGLRDDTDAAALTRELKQLGGDRHGG